MESTVEKQLPLITCTLGNTERAKPVLQHPISVRCVKSTWPAAASGILLADFCPGGATSSGLTRGTIEKRLRTHDRVIAHLGPF